MSCCRNCWSAGTVEVRGQVERKRIDSVDASNLGNVVHPGELRTLERYWAWGRTFKDLTMIASIGLNIASAGIAIAQLYFSNNDHPDVVIALMVSAFVLLLIGLIPLCKNNYNAVEILRGYRNQEGGSNAVGVLAPTWLTVIFTIIVGCAGFGTQLSGVLQKDSGTLVAGSVLNIVAPLIALVGFTISLARFDKEKEIIINRHFRHLNRNPGHEERNHTEWCNGEPAYIFREN